MRSTRQLLNRTSRVQGRRENLGFGFPRSRERAVHVDSRERLMNDPLAHPLSAVPRRVAVYCSASRSAPPSTVVSAERLGRGLARLGWELVYGACAHGSMGAVASGFRAEGSGVVGVVPRFLRDRERCDPLSDEQVVLTEDLLERKRVMMDLADAFVVLPGGYGTLDELADLLALAALQRSDCDSVVLVNEGSYFGPLLEFCKRMEQHGFVGHSVDEILVVVPGVDEALKHLERIWAPPSTKANERNVQVLQIEQIATGAVS